MQSAPSLVCPYCGTEIDASEAHICPECHAHYHIACWEKNSGCTTSACKRAAVNDEKSNISPPATTALPDTDIYVMSDGHQLGPLNLQQLQQMIESGTFTAQTLVWHQEIPEWTELGSAMPKFFSIKEANDSSLTLSSSAAIQNRFPGMDRLKFCAALVGWIIFCGMTERADVLIKTALGAILGSTFFTAIAAFLTQVPSLTPHDDYLFEIIFGIVLLILISARAENIGHSPWHCLLTLIPFYSIFLYGYYLVAPTGYKRSKKIDKVGYVMLSLIIFLIVAFILTLIVGVTIENSGK